jgi:UDP-GlcNAc:undecaprenyl-phosphate GlcNAc-1-phosphate transferase
MPLLIALALALVLTPAARRVGRAASIVDRPSDDALKIHTEPVPLLGGVAVVVAAFVAVAVTGQMRWLTWGAVAVSMLAGLLDDVGPLRPWPRLMLQLLAGALLAGHVLTDAGAVGPRDLAVAVGALLLVPACANAVNVTDGQDGLAGGLAAIGALGLAWLGVEMGSEEVRVAGLSLAGGLGGFLIWNRPPARIYLGNGGAYAVGALLAALAIPLISRAGWRGLVGAGACLGLFAFELAFTVTRRAIGRRRLMQGDRQHSYDLLAEDVGGRGRATMILFGCGALFVLLARFFATAPAVSAAAAGALAAGAAVAVGLHLLRRATRVAEEGGHGKDTNERSEGRSRWPSRFPRPGREHRRS